MATVTGFDLDSTSGGLNGARSYTEGAAAILLAPAATVSATGSFGGQTLVLSGLSAELLIGFSGGVSISGNSVRIGLITIGTVTGGTGGADLVITFNAFANASRVQTLIRGLTFQDSSDTPIVTHAVSFNLAGTVRTDTVTVTPVNDPPAVDLNGAGGGSNASVAFIEQTPVKIAPAATLVDPDSNLVSLTARLLSRPDGNAAESLALDAAAALAGAEAGLTVGYNQATGTLTVTGSASQAVYQAILQGIVYNDTSDNPATSGRTVSVTAGDGAATSVVRTASISVARANDAPVVDLNGSAAGTSIAIGYTIGGPLKKIAPGGTITDLDTANFNGGSLRISLGGDGTAGDRLAIVTDPTVGLTNGGARVTVQGVAIGNVSGGTNGSDLVITFNNDNATLSRVKILLEHIGYANNTGGSLSLTREVTFTLDDGDGTANGGDSTGSATATIALQGKIIIDLSTLSASGGFIIQGDAAGDLAGRSVSDAGDVNGDGFADLIVGAPFGDDGGNLAGEAYVLFGKASGFGTIDLTTLSATDGFVIQGDAEGDDAGYSVSGAGDVNGDGFADLIVGAPYGDDGGFSAGEAYVVFGKASGFGTDVDGRQVIDLTTLSDDDGFIIQGDADDDLAGWSVSGAGDVNGDGFADLIVGAPFGDDGGEFAGEAYVVFGKPSGFGTIDLATLSATDGFIIQGDADFDRAGWSVSGAGDVNGDGFADLIVGAPFGNDGDPNAGEAYVVFGKPSGFGTDVDGRQVIDLTTLSDVDGFVIRADAAGDKAGWSVSGAGDVNGDGFADLIVGAPNGDDGGFSAGEAYVVFGKASGFGTVDGTGRAVIDLTTLSATDGFIIQGDAAFDYAGWSVSGAGDINGDGFADLIVGSPNGDDGGSNAGEAYVVFGKASGFGTDVDGRQVIDLTTLTAADGFVIQGDAAGDEAGFSVSGAGDVNGDGFADLIVGAPYGDDGGSNAGEAYVLFGAAFGTTVTTTGTAAAEIFIGGIGGDTLEGGGGGDVFHAGAGDDTIVVADLSFALVDGGSGTDTLVLEGADLALDLTDRIAAARIEGIEIIELLGCELILDQLAVFNETPASGDGLHVLTVTGDAGDTVTFTEAQWAHVGTVVDGADTFERYVFGNAEVRIEQGVGVEFPTLFDLTFLGHTQGFIIQGDEDLDGAGWSVSGAGDVNGDGFDDLIVGAAFSFNTYYSSYHYGTAYVVFGKESEFGTTVNTGGFDRQVIDLTTLSAADGFVIQGASESDQAGFSVSGAGDVNGDGFADLIVGARAADNGDGEAYVLFGKAGGFGTIDIATLSAADGFVIQGADFDGGNAGYSVSAAGDVNGDGFDDLIVGAPFGHDGGSAAGQAYVLFGKASGFGTIDLATLSAADGFVIQGDAAHDYAGWSVSAAGDVNGDGFADLIVGASFADDVAMDAAGEAYVLFGKASGFGTIDLATLSATDDGFIIQGDAGDLAGFSVSGAGDVNGDGFADLIVGAPNGDNGGVFPGEACVLFGKASGFGTIDLATLSAADGFIIQGDAHGDAAGRSVSGAGDVNGDGFADLIVGAPAGDDGGDRAGEAYVLFGKAGGFGTIDLATLSAADGFVIQGDAVLDYAGWSVSGAGDVNGDGFADLFVGARYGDDGGTNAGEAYVLFGGAFGNTVTTTGTAAAEIFIGGVGDDDLDGGGGADVFHAGAGDDTVTAAGLAFALADGGSGTDLLVLTGAGATFDFTALADTRTQGIEAIDFDGSGANTLKLGLSDALNLSDTPHAGFTAGPATHNSLVIEGGSGDTLELVDPADVSGTWTLFASDVSLTGIAGGGYAIWSFDTGTSDLIKVAVDADIGVSLL